MASLFFKQFDLEIGTSKFSTIKFEATFNRFFFQVTFSEFNRERPRNHASPSVYWHNVNCFSLTVINLV